MGKKTIPSNVPRTNRLNVNVSTGEESPAMPNIGPTTAEQTTTAPDISAPYAEVMKGFKQLCSLSAEGQDYLDKLMATMNSSKRKFELETHKDPIAGEVKIIKDSQSSNYAVLAFTETANGGSLQIDRFRDIRESIQNTDDSMSQCIQSIIVDKESGDYAKYDRMAAHLFNAFVSSDDNCVVNVSTYAKMQLEANTNTKLAKEFIERRSPHGISERIDWAVLIEQNQATRQSQDIYNIANRQNFKMPIMAIGGYTKFVMDNRYGTPVIVPIVTITNITSDLPHVDIINVVLPIIADTIICRKAYLRPYLTFSKDAPNLGYMFQNAQDPGSLKFFQSIEEVEREAAPFIQPPILALDVTEGRANIAGFDSFYFVQGSITESAASFFGPQIIDALNTAYATIPQLPPAPFMKSYRNYEGVVSFNGKTIDSREIDYMNIIAAMKSSNPTIANFLKQYESADTRFKTIADLCGADQVKPLYRTNTILFHPGYVNTLSNAFRGVIHYLNAVTLDPQTISITDLFGTNPQQMNLNGIGFGSVSPFNGGYRVDDHNPYHMW